ncbi:MAG: hypothetical protein US51_C0017G0006 [Microgenomates group bacterium GW2011_GWA2_37_6]|nr:MAG: hypothetical protein US51_C0017G0006 [Microgenomates group bacterium GW2011_GWA2_37_6]
MDYITTTQLRTKSSELVRTLREGRSVDLVHRSKVVGTIKPDKEEPKIMTKDSIERLKELAKQMSLPKTSYAQREKNYRNHMMKKYGKHIS